jgi:methionine-rich copper-binding protein CopC
VRLTFILLAIATTSMLVATAVAHPLAAARSLAEDDALVEQQPPERSLVGTLDQVDADATVFVVKTTNGKQRFVLQSGATIRQGSKTIKAADLASHKGEKVKVRYREASGEHRAEWVVVASPPSKAKTGA